MVMLDSPTSNTTVEKTGDPVAQRPSVSNSTSSLSTGGLNISMSASQGAAGSGWQTKKFQEEYDRSMSQVLDQKWSMCKCKFWESPLHEDNFKDVSASYPDPLLRKRST